jgi:hypothetical protein
MEANKISFLSAQVPQTKNCIIYPLTNFFLLQIEILEPKSTVLKKIKQRNKWHRSSKSFLFVTAVHFMFGA